jgi:hypothetical protein
MRINFHLFLVPLGKFLWRTGGANEYKESNFDTSQEGGAIIQKREEIQIKQKREEIQIKQ